MTRKENIIYYLFLLFFVVLFWAHTDVLNGIVIGVLLLCGILYNPIKEKWTLLKERKHMVFMLLFFVMLGVSLYLSDNTSRGFRYLDTRLALFYFPVAIGLIYISKSFKEKILMGFAVITTIACFVCLCYSIYASGFFKRPELLYNDSLTHLIGRQSIYISLLVNISIFIFSYWIFYKPLGGNKKALLLLAVAFLFSISYLLASRSMMVVLYAITICFIVYYIFKRKKYLEGATLLMAMLIGIFLIFKFFPQTINRFKELTYTQYNYSNKGKESHYNMEVTKEQWNGANFRLAAWQCGWNLFKQHPFVGVGLGDKRDELMKEYEKKDFQFGIATKKNVHNNYLDILMSTGVIGLLLFLLGWILFPIYYSVKKKDWLAVLIICTISFALITEIYFDRTMGGMVVGFFVPFLLTDYKGKDS